MAPLDAPRPAPRPDRLAVADEFASLVWRAGRWMRGVSSADEGVSASHAAVLAHLAAEGPLTGADLARREGVSPQAMAVTLAALQERGLTARVQASDDERRRPAALTDEGRRTLERVSRRRAEAVHEGLLAALSDTEVQALEAGLRAVRRAQDAHAVGGRT